MCVLCLVAQSCPTLCDPMDYIAHRFLCPWVFSKQEYRSGFPCPPLGDLPNPVIEPRSPALQADSLLSGPPGKLWLPVCANIPLKVHFKEVNYMVCESHLKKPVKVRTTW